MPSANKIGNEYQSQYPAYENTPKAVIAAVALSLAKRLCEDDECKAATLLSEEWATLHQAGIVPQPPARPPAPRNGSIRRSNARRLASVCRERGKSFADHQDGTVTIDGERFGTNMAAELYILGHKPS